MISGSTHAVQGPKSGTMSATCSPIKSLPNNEELAKLLDDVQAGSDFPSTCRLYTFPQIKKLVATPGFTEFSLARYGVDPAQLYKPTNFHANRAKNSNSSTRSSEELFTTTYRYYIEHTAPRLFLIMLNSDSPSFLLNLIDERFNDSFLPLQKSKRDWHLFDVFPNGRTLFGQIVELQERWFISDRIDWHCRIIGEERELPFEIVKPGLARSRFHRKQLYGVKTLTAREGETDGVGVVVGDTEIVDRLAGIRGQIEAFARVSWFPHKHVIQGMGIIQIQDRYHIPMLPFCERTLEQYLAVTSAEDAIDSLHSSHRRSNLLRWIYCLTCAVRHLRKVRVCHWDIQPRNIVLRGNEIYLANFEFGRILPRHDDPMIEESEAEFPDPVALRYARNLDYKAPEQFEPGYVGYIADVFSLGCVIADLLVVMTGRSVEEFRKYRRTKRSLYRRSYTYEFWDYSFHRNLEKAFEFLEDCVAARPGVIGPVVIIELLRRMLILDQWERMYPRRIMKFLEETMAIPSPQIHRCCSWTDYEDLSPEERLNFTYKNWEEETDSEKESEDEEACAHVESYAWI